MSDLEPSYWERVRDRAAELGSDGCTMGTRLFRDCCLEHDIFWRTQLTLNGEPISFDEADKRFLSCMQSRSKVGWWTPIGWLRYGLVRSIGRLMRPKREEAST